MISLISICSSIFILLFFFLVIKFLDSAKDCTSQSTLQLGLATGPSDECHMSISGRCNLQVTFLRGSCLSLTSLFLSYGNWVSVSLVNWDKKDRRTPKDVNKLEQSTYSPPTTWLLHGRSLISILFYPLYFLSLRYL